MAMLLGHTLGRALGQLSGCVLTSLALAGLCCLTAQVRREATVAQPQAVVAREARQTVPVIKTKVRQVVLDVVVTDHKNKPVRGLGPKDFLVFEDKKPQQILSFEAHSRVADESKRADELPRMPVLPPNTFLSLPTQWDSLPLNVLLYDVLNTPLEDQVFARKAMIKFFKNRPPGSRFAIFVLSDKLHLLQGFTDDEDLLLSALNRKETTAINVFSASSPGAETLSEFLSATGGPQQLVDRMEQMDSLADSYFLTTRVERTISAFLEIARFLGGWTGRKNLIWLSGAFPEGVLPGGEVLDPFAAINYSAEIHEAVDRMTVSQVAVYPVDVRGMMVDPAFSAANARGFREPGALARAERRFTLQLAADHFMMRDLAEGSGGHAFYNTNGLEQAIATAVKDGTSYYTLSYSPTNTNFDGGLRKIRVGLPGKRYTLSYRRSYFADDEGKLEKKAAMAPFVHIEGTMQRGAPAAHEIVFELHVATEGGYAEVTPEQRDDLSRFVAFAHRKKWDDVQTQRYSFDYWVPARQFSFAPPSDGEVRANLEFLAAAYDEDGKPMNGQLSAADEVIPQEDLEKIRRHAFHARQELDVPKQAAWLRVAVRDPEANRVGTVEIRLPLRPEAVELPKNSLQK